MINIIIYDYTITIILYQWYVDNFNYDNYCRKYMKIYTFMMCNTEIPDIQRSNDLISHFL